MTLPQLAVLSGDQVKIGIRTVDKTEVAWGTSAGVVSRVWCEAKEKQDMETYSDSVCNSRGTSSFWYCRGTSGPFLM